MRSPAVLFTCAHIKTLCAGWQENTCPLSSNGHLYARYVKVLSLCGFNWKVNYVGGAHGGVFGAWDCGRPGQRLGRPGNSGFRVPSLLKNLYIGIWQIPPDSAPKLSWQKTGLIIAWSNLSFECRFHKTFTCHSKLVSLWQKKNWAWFDFLAISFLAYNVVLVAFDNLCVIFPMARVTGGAGNSESCPHYIKLHTTPTGCTLFGHFFCWYIYPA